MLSITHKSHSPLPARQAGGPVWKARRIERISREDPCRLVRQVNQFWAPVRDLRSCQTSWQGAGDDALSFLACQTGVPATQGGRGETKIVGNTECFAWERTQRTLRVSLCGKSRVTRCYGNPVTQSVQGVRDDAKHRHEVGDGLGEYLHPAAHSIVTRLLIWRREPSIAVHGSHNAKHLFWVACRQAGSPGHDLRDLLSLSRRFPWASFLGESVGALHNGKSVSETPNNESRAAC